MAVSNFEVKPINKVKKSSKPKKQETSVFLVEQELKFAKVLASNDKKLRDKVLKNLRKWLGYRSQSSFSFEEEDFMRLWKGLFYCMWMSDKPLIQEELAENISNLVHSFSNSEDAILFFKCFLKTMAREWFGIDYHRLNKFFMFIRRMLRQSLVILAKEQWNDQLTEQFGDAILTSVLKQNNALGLAMHLSEIYLEEVAKVSEGKIDKELVTPLLKPFALYLAESTDRHTSCHISHHVFLMLLHQSDAGLDYQEKFEAWKKQGFPGGNIDCMQKVEETDSENELEPILNGKNEDDALLEEHLKHSDAKDPRAGNVDVVLPQIMFDATAIAAMVDSLIFGANSNVKSRKLLRTIVERFNKFSEGEFPLGIKEIAIPAEGNLKKTDIKKAANDLIKFEQSLYADSAKNLKKKKKLNKKAEVLKTEINRKPGAKSERNKDVISTVSKEKRKRRSVEPLLKEETKKIQRRSSNEWKVENLDTSLELSDTSTAPSNIGSVSDIKPEMVTSSNSKTIKGKLLKRKDTENSCQNEINKSISNEWNKPLEEGETEYFVPSRKRLLKTANETLQSDVDLLSPVKTPKKLLKQSDAVSVEKVYKKTPKQILKKKKNALSLSNDSIKSSNIANTLLLNPFAVASPNTKSPKNKINKTSTPVQKKSNNLCVTPVGSKLLNKSANSSEKRVKIVLKHNISQNTEEYIEQIRSSPQIPFDAERKPMKTLLKPSVAPSRINPYYKFQEDRTKK